MDRIVRATYAADSPPHGYGGLLFPHIAFYLCTRSQDLRCVRCMHAPPPRISLRTCFTFPAAKKSPLFLPRRFPLNAFVISACWLSRFQSARRWIMNDIINHRNDTSRYRRITVNKNPLPRLRGLLLLLLATRTSEERARCVKCYEIFLSFFAYSVHLYIAGLDHPYRQLPDYSGPKFRLPPRVLDEIISKERKLKSLGGVFNQLVSRLPRLA